MPPRAAELAVGDPLQADLFLLGDDLADLGVLDRLERGRVDLAASLFRARLLERRGAKDRADMVGAEGGNITHHGRLRGGVYRKGF